MIKNLLKSNLTRIKDGVKCRLISNKMIYEY